LGPRYRGQQSDSEEADPRTAAGILLGKMAMIAGKNGTTITMGFTNIYQAFYGDIMGIHDE